MIQTNTSTSATIQTFSLPLASRSLPCSSLPPRFSSAPTAIPSLPTPKRPLSPFPSFSTLDSPRFPHFHGFPRNDSADRKAPRGFRLPRGSPRVANRIENIPQPQKKHRILGKRFRQTHYPNNRGNPINMKELRFEFGIEFEFDRTIRRLQTRQNRRRFHRGFHDSTFRLGPKRTLGQNP